MSYYQNNVAITNTKPEKQYIMLLKNPVLIKKQQVHRILLNSEYIKLLLLTLRKFLNDHYHKIRLIPAKESIQMCLEHDKTVLNKQDFQ